MTTMTVGSRTSNPVLGFTNASEGEHYTVKQGDTLYGICKRLGIALQDLLAANPSIRDPNSIKKGQVLNLPEDGPAEPAPVEASAPAPEPEVAQPEPAARPRNARVPPPVVNARARDLVNSGSRNPTTPSMPEAQPEIAPRAITPAASAAPPSALDSVRQGQAEVRRGQKGAAVTELQQLLTKAGYPVGIDGDFGPQTEGAVKRFQTAQGLASSGVVNKSTLDALDRATATTGPTDEVEPPAPSLDDVRNNGAVIQRGQAGPSVAQMQKLLTARGFGVQATGKFGPTTESVLKNFQKANGLTADGRLDARSLAALEGTGSNTNNSTRALNTPILNQHTSGTYPGGYCAITALRMTLRLEGKNDPGADTVALGGAKPYTPGQGSSGALLAKRARELGLSNASFTTTGSLADVKRELAKGHAVPMGGLGRFRGTNVDNGSVWDHSYNGSGHWMTAVGWDEASKSFLVNDPDRGARFRVSESDFARFFAPEGGSSVWMLKY